MTRLHISMCSCVLLLLLGSIAAGAAATLPTTAPAGPSPAELAGTQIEEWKPIVAPLTLPTGPLTPRIRFRAPSTFIGIGYNATPVPLVVRFILLGGSADKAEVKVNDKIISFAGVENPDGYTLQSLLRDGQPGEEVKLVVQRMGLPIELKVRLMSVDEMMNLTRRPENSQARP
jgi:S1-C subfamily serine protease